jgi:hypothetical protein
VSDDLEILVSLGPINKIGLGNLILKTRWWWIGKNVSNGARAKTTEEPGA